ncbi:MAG: DUF433 domain-containing protein [bacterium]
MCWLRANFFGEKNGKKLIISDPGVMMGKPVIASKRVTVELILEKLAAGETIDQILESHPGLTFERIQAALRFAANALKAKVAYPGGELSKCDW